MPVGLPPLPLPLESVPHPAYFWPSRWSATEACALSVWGEAGATDLLPPVPEGVFGTVLHEARRRFRAEWDGMGSAKDRMKKCLSDVLDLAERDLVTSGHSELVPLESHVGWHRWQDRTKRLYAWAASQHPSLRRRNASAPPSGPSHAHGPVVGNKFGVGVEPLWQSEALRLRGRPDEVWRDESGDLCISDFKSGRVTDESTEVVEAIRVQLHLYALMAEELAPGTKIKLLVSGASDHALAWGSRERKDTRDRLRSVSDAFPKGDASTAASMAAPGRQCVGCRIRHLCSRYLEIAPSWWPNEQGHPRPLPWDVWGQVTCIRSSQQAWSMEMRDRAGRSVQVEGVVRSRPLDHVSPLDELYLFGLEPAEDVRPHGLPIQPRNFYEIAPGPPWRSAVGLRLFGPNAAHQQRVPNG